MSAGFRCVCGSRHGCSEAHITHRQSFHPPTSLRDFYRYIRIDFDSHYGNEYYCPISLLRVYGLTHLEQWKWDIWEAESRAKLAELEEARAISSPIEDDSTEPTH